MSEGKKRWPYAEAVKLAGELEQALRPFCERVMIAGSLRRHKQDVGDIEILYIPLFEERQADMFSTEPMDLAHEELGRWLCNGTLSKRPSVTGSFTWGAKNKLAVHRDGIPVDFFATTAENWWVSLVIRTGGKATNLKLTTGAKASGMTLNAYGSGFTLQNKEIVPAHSEHDVFRLAGVPYTTPQERE